MLGYEVFDIRQLYETLHHAEDTVTNLACSALAEYVGKHDSLECTPESTEHGANSLIDLEQYGIGGTDISIITFAYVKTYRLITGSGEVYAAGENLNTANGVEE